MAAAVVTKDTLIGDLLRIDANVAPILLGIGMHCLAVLLLRVRQLKKQHLFMALILRN